MKKKNFFLAHKQFTFFLILALLIILGAIFAPVVTGGADPLKGSLTEALAAPSRAHIFGTDKMGRDIFTRVIYGARASLSATFGVVALIFLVGTAAGVTAGYFGGWVDGVIMRIADMMLAFPGLVLALAVAGIIGYVVYPVWHRLHDSAVGYSAFFDSIRCHLVHACQASIIVQQGSHHGDAPCGYNLFPALRNSKPICHRFSYRVE